MTYTYDPNGNLTQKTEGADTWGYEWNARDELTRVTKNSVEQARFSYDPIGRRVEKVAGGVTTSYTYDAEAVLREMRGSAVLRYVQGLGMDEPLAVEDSSGSLGYYHADWLGSIVKRTSQSGAVAHEYRYDAWGNIELGATEPGYSFTGREWDPETKLYYYRARYYDPKLGRFISEDPIGFDGGVNLFAYADNNPANLNDAFGLQSADLRNEWSVSGTQPSPPGRGPDFLTIGIGGPVKGVVGTGFSFTFDRYGRFYISWNMGPGVGFPAMMKLTCSTLTQSETPTREELESFIGGRSYGLEGYLVVGGGVSKSGDRYAVEAGFGTPQVSGAVSQTTTVSQTSDLRSQRR